MYFTFHFIRHLIFSFNEIPQKRARHKNTVTHLFDVSCCCCRAFSSPSLSKRQNFEQTSPTKTKKMEFLNLLGIRCFSCDTFNRMRHWCGVWATIACFVTRHNSSILFCFHFHLFYHRTPTQLIILLLFHFACYRRRRAYTDEAGSSAVVSTNFSYSTSTLFLKFYAPKIKRSFCQWTTATPFCMLAPQTVWHSLAIDVKNVSTPVIRLVTATINMPIEFLVNNSLHIWRIAIVHLQNTTLFCAIYAENTKHEKPLGVAKRKCRKSKM